MTKWDYTEETVIGHHVAARLEESMATFDIPNIEERPPMVEIEVGDVDWDDTQNVRIRLDELAKLTDAMIEEYEEYDDE